jgi:hypothetical protein
MIADREPALAPVRDVLETHPAAERLVSQCRSSRSQNLWHFATASKAADRTVRR